MVDIDAVCVVLMEQLTSVLISARVIGHLAIVVQSLDLLLAQAKLLLQVSQPR